MITITHGDKTLTMPHIMQLDFWVFDAFQNSQKAATSYQKAAKRLRGLEEKLEELSKSEDATDKLKNTVKEEYKNVKEEVDDKTSILADAQMDFIKSLLKRYPQYEEFTRGYSISDHHELQKYLGKETGEFEFISGAEDFLV